MCDGKFWRSGWVSLKLLIERSLINECVFRRSLAAIGLIEGVMRLSRVVFNYRYGEKLTVYVVYDKQTVKISITSIDTIEHFKAVVGVMIGVDVNDFDLELNGLPYYAFFY